jgi:WhiB family redox-sensing transcriptional regulator
MAKAPWSDLAACRGERSHLFYSPDTAESREARLRRERQAKQLCATCPVLEECREAALAQREGYGIWGGLNEMERRALLRR